MRVLMHLILIVLVIVAGFIIGMLVGWLWAPKPPLAVMRPNLIELGLSSTQKAQSTQRQ